MFLLNVYIPYEYDENKDEFLDRLGKLYVTIE